MTTLGCVVKKLLCLPQHLCCEHHWHQCSLACLTELAGQMLIAGQMVMLPPSFLACCRRSSALPFPAAKTPPQADTGKAWLANVSVLGMQAFTPRGFRDGQARTLQPTTLARVFRLRNTFGICIFIALRSHAFRKESVCAPAMVERRTASVTITYCGFSLVKHKQSHLGKGFEGGSLDTCRARLGFRRQPPRHWSLASRCSSRRRLQAGRRP